MVATVMTARSTQGAEGLGGGDAVGLGDVGLEVLLGAVLAVRCSGRARAPRTGRREAMAAIQPPGSRLARPPSSAAMAMTVNQVTPKRAEGGEDQWGVVAGGDEPAEAADAVGGEGEEGGEEAGDEGQPSAGRRGSR